MLLNKFNLQLFATQTTLLNTPGNDLSPEMKTFYDKALIRFAKPNLVHDQFAQIKNIPKNGGKIIEFRKYTQLPKLLTPLTEGVTPNSQNLNVTTLTAEVAQYGGYIELSDVLMLTAIDNNLAEAIELLGDQAGRTLDTITREVINAGTNVQYAGTATSRTALTSSDKLSVMLIKKAVRTLKVGLAKKINGYYVAIIHPDTAFDIMNDPEWISASEYAGSTQLFEGEIGKIHGVRFIETTEAKIFAAEPLTAESANLSVKTTISSASTSVAVKEAISAEEATALAGRAIILNGIKNEIVSATAGAAGSAALTLKSAVTATANDALYPGEGGAEGRSVYSTLVLGANAYGTTAVEGGGLQSIVKQLGSAGTADPLNQRSSAGWKAIKTAEILVNDYMVRLETCSTYDSAAN